jgi:glycosyltransferase involved in cell wall biosynthesis
VTIVVVNYNYGGFLHEAVASVFRQTYPAIECIIVDDRSSDDSRVIIDDIRLIYPHVKTIFRSQNGGQSLACRDGFKASAGQYVIFLDADDFLLPTAVETHVFVHLSVRVPVGFSSGDMVQSIDGEMVLGTRQCLSEYVRSGKGKKRELFRSIATSLGRLSPLPEIEALDDKVHFVEPGSATWVWSPMSGNCYRRDALKFVLDNPALASLKRSTDAYLNLGINVLTGSVLIDRPIAVYRLHGANGLSQHPQLNGFFSFKKSCAIDNPQRSRLLLINYFIECADDLVRRSTVTHLLQALEELGRHVSFHGMPFYLSRQLWKRGKELRRHMSRKAFLIWSLHLLRRKI